MAIVLELVSRAVQPAQSSAAGRNPEIPTAVFEDVLHRVLLKRGRVRGVVIENGELIAVVAIESFLGAEPHEALRVLNDSGNKGLG